ncbi:MAG: glycosyltransferase family A protein [Paracoccus sp. (in: a-proteobacteria)]|nr:glycosyltransferase family A protein [Paracoccus sp. (in: a-proteobacteria)]
MILSVVIPSRNPETRFLDRMAALCTAHPDWQVIVVDDASDQQLVQLLPRAANLTVLRNPECLGAGASRNAALDLIDGEFTVYLDDDDEMDWAVIETLMDRMRHQPEIDMAQSSYSMIRDGMAEPARPQDQEILASVLAGQSSRVVTLEGNEDLLRLTNYPWTKLFRTRFLRRIGLRYSETSVQNDIFAHWQSLIGAQCILVTDLVQCVQLVRSGSGRLSGISDARRLQAFLALQETLALVRLQDRPEIEAAFWRFYHDLIWWMLDISTPVTRPRMMAQHLRFAALLPSSIAAMPQMRFFRWNLWAMEHLTPEIGPLAEAEPETLSKDQLRICLDEILRLRQYSSQLRAENGQLREARRSDRRALHQQRDIGRAKDQRISELEHLMAARSVRFVLALRAVLVKIRSRRDSRQRSRTD